VPALSREEEAVLALYRALDEDARREIRAVAEEKKRLREVERALAELRAELAGAKKRA
jgi:septal ring factor EnvC (AmiA/AmiB activator)